MSNYTYAYTHAPHQQHSHLIAPCWHQIRMHHINSVGLHSWFCYQQLQFACKPTLPPLPLSFCPLILTQPPTSFTGCCWFFFLFLWRSSLQKKMITGHRGAWHFRLDKTQKLSSHACPIRIRKARAQLGTVSQQMAFPGRELASVPAGQGLAMANMPRQGIGKRSQAGN